MSQTHSLKINKYEVEPHETHEIFFKTITRNKLNELLNRVTTKYLERQINKVLKGYKAITELNTKKCKYIIIKFTDLNNNKIGHITLHLDKVNRNMSNSNQMKGRLHAVNNRNKNKYYTFRVSHKNDLYEMKVNSYLKMSQDLDYCVTTTLRILNDYTEPNSSYFLGKRLTILGSKNNDCLIKIAGPEGEHSRFRTTRSQKQNTISISKKLSKPYNWKTKKHINEV
jgi:hypothetical protein